MKKLFALSILAIAFISSAFAQGNILLNSSSSNSKFICGESQITDYDGNKYTTVQIGKQCWTKENLRTTHYSDGTPIPLYADAVIEYPTRYLPNNDEKLVSTYGYLYNWQAATNSIHGFSKTSKDTQDLCPTGWHVPSDAEWTQLTDFVSSQSEYVCGNDNRNLAKALASSNGWQDSPFKCSIGYKSERNNATGFSALPAGQFLELNEYDHFREYASFWSSTKQDMGTAYYRCLKVNYEVIFGSASTLPKYMGCSVRCVQDTKE